MIIGTAGHIDHGKTSLVKALTGINADRLKEEQERGITLDLGYAYTPLPDGEVLGFIDVPGHEKLVHNMLAGVTGIDYVLLVVAADDGVMPQTVEHLHILDLLGLDHGAVALTKVDMVTPERAQAVAAEITRLLAPTGLATSLIFPLSSVTGLGVADLRQHLDQAAAALPRRGTAGGFRLAVDRAFSLNGVGTVVTGTVFSGMVSTGDHLLVSPSGKEVRVRGMHAQNRPAERGLSGQRCALNLVGVEKQQIMRGDWVVPAFLHAPTTRIDVVLQLLATAPPMRHWSQVHVHLGAAHVTARVALQEGETLQPAAATFAQLVLDRPLCGAYGDRFILRDASARNTLAGGRILDTQAPLRNRRSEQRLAMLKAWQEPMLEARVQRLLEASPNGLDLVAFARNANLTPEELSLLLATIPCVQAKLRPPATAFSAMHWQRLCETALAVLTAEHSAVSDSLGLNAEQLRMRTAPQVTRNAFFALIEQLLLDGRLAKEGSWLHLPGHRITLGELEAKLWADVEPLLAHTPFQPPRVRDLAQLLGQDETHMRNLLRRLARMGLVYLVAHDHYFLSQAVSELATLVRQAADAHVEGEIYAAEFRSRIDCGRKLAIHILEFFDRVGFTRRVRDAHRIRNDLLQF